MEKISLVVIQSCNFCTCHMRAVSHCGVRLFPLDRTIFISRLILFSIVEVVFPPVAPDTRQNHMVSIRKISVSIFMDHSRGRVPVL